MHRFQTAHITLEAKPVKLVGIGVKRNKLIQAQVLRCLLEGPALEQNMWA